MLLWHLMKYKCRTIILLIHCKWEITLFLNNQPCTFPFNKFDISSSNHANVFYKIRKYIRLTHTSAIFCFLSCLEDSVKALWSVSIIIKVLLDGSTANFLGVYFNWVLIWLKTAPSFSNAKILSINNNKVLIKMQFPAIMCG